MPQTFALCFVHDLNPDKCNPDKCTTRISAHVLQAPCATFVCNCTQISAQSPSKCHSKSWAYTVDCVMICAFCLNGLLYEREKETPKRKLTTLNIDQKIEILNALQWKPRNRAWNYALRPNPDKCTKFSCRIDVHLSGFHCNMRNFFWWNYVCPLHTITSAPFVKRWGINYLSVFIFILAVCFFFSTWFFILILYSVKIVDFLALNSKTEEMNCRIVIKLIPNHRPSAPPNCAKNVSIVHMLVSRNVG